MKVLRDIEWTITACNKAKQEKENTFSRYTRKQQNTRQEISYTETVTTDGNIARHKKKNIETKLQKILMKKWGEKSFHSLTERK